MSPLKLQSIIKNQSSIINVLFAIIYTKAVKLGKMCGALKILDEKNVKLKVMAKK